MPKLNELNDLFVKELRDTYDAEKQITKALPKMAKAATFEELRAAFDAHLEETRGQIVRLEQVFDLLDLRPLGKHCPGMAGLIEEGVEIMEEDGAPSVIDAGLIASAQRVEHYEMAAYGTLVALAEQLAHDDAARLLKQSLDEEKRADEQLTALAEQVVNPLAADMPADGDDALVAESRHRRR